MKKYKNYYKKIFNELIPNSKKFNFNNFSNSVDIDCFLNNLKLTTPSFYKKINKVKLSKNETVHLIGDQINEAYFLSKKVLKKLKEYEKRNFFDKKISKQREKIN